MVGLTLFDYVLLFILLASGVTSLFRGFFREAISLAGWVVAGWVAWRMGPAFSGWLDAWLSDAALRLWVSRAILFVLVLMLSGLLGRFMSVLMVSTGLTGTDRALGIVFGLARGMIFCGLLLMVLELLGFAESAWWQQSKLIPYAAPVADIIRYAAEDGLEYLDQLEMPNVSDLPGLPEDN
ncbi:MAG: CvpA family protein [Gammaproteobacteria bacterium]